MTSSHNQLILIDGNALLHRAFHAYPYLTTSSGEEVNAVYGFTIMLTQVLEKFKPQYIVVTFDKKGPTFRHQEFTQYKAQRKPMDSSLASQIKRTYELVEAFNIPIFAVEGYEADDLIGTIAKKAREMESVDEVIVVTGDRDLLQLLDDKIKAFMPGRTFGEGSVIDEKTFEAKWGFKPIQLIDFKAIRGDTSDNIPGVHGIGDVGATKLIKQFGSIENMYEHLDEIEGKTKTKLIESAETAVMSKRLATIDTQAPIQFDLEACNVKHYDVQKVAKLFEELEFKSLLKKIQKFDANKDGKIDVQELEKTQEDSSGVTESKLESLLKDQPPQIAQLDRDMLPVLERMHENGILVDRPVLEQLKKDFDTKLEKLRQELYEIAGHEFNINSPKQLAELLFDHLKLPVVKHTKTGRSTDESVLQELSLSHPIAEKLLEYRELHKLQSTYVEALPKYIADDGRIHSKLHLDVAVTGRLASSDPNMQNIPIKGQWGMAIRRAFISPPGYVLLAVDYSQIELRILAHLSEDDAMKEIFSEDRDIHASTAALIFNVPVDQVSKDQRRSAKTINFGLMYGMGAHALSRDLKITFSQAQLFIKAYFDAFPKVKQWVDGILKSGVEKGYVETVMGRRRYLPELKSSDRRIQSAGQRMAINMPAQGTQAEMIKLAMVHIDALIQEESKNWKEGAHEIKMLLQVHDELVFEVREDVVDKWSKIICEEMKGALPLSVPVSVGVNVGKRWGEMKSVE